MELIEWITDGIGFGRPLPPSSRFGLFIARSRHESDRFYTRILLNSDCHETTH